ncbi:uncharacterized protein BYT42DRAFT_602330 [Radiomyces spectabilis]|uniref:uncharacterized protein n=1 Tax=Radiomyces spectabilis TaxID=64574 RepID=UPI00221FD2BC|nr:uncharacterized protein BYT42DRAFT_602330 [Radiomyces spectabilis]KAI8391510.1 hypothetical protein BYT42DRAFT_602330 [Radiomyces spectabilis]
MKLLHRFPEEEYAQFGHYLEQYQPHTSALLGWFLCSGYAQVDRIGRAKIYTSHAQPFNTPDSVVWIVDSRHRLRVFVTSEIILNDAPMTATAKEHAVTKEWKGGDHAWFEDAEHEALYRRSEALLEPILRSFMETHPEILFHGLSVLWGPTVHRVANVQFDGPCRRFVHPISAFNEIAQYDGSYQMRKLTVDNVDQVIKHNKIAYEREYVADCLQFSSTLWTSDEAPVAWAMTHRDLCIGALFVRPEYRRQGLAALIVADLCHQHAKFFEKHGLNPNLEHYAQAVVECDNGPSAAMFTRLGWQTVGPGLTWIFCSKPN